MNYLDPQAFCSCPQIRIGEGSPFETWDSPGWTDVEEPSRSPRGDNVVDLMAALKKSLEGGSGGTATKAPAKSKAKPAAKKPAAKTSARKKAS